MKNLFSILAIGLSLSLYAGHHEEGEADASMHENNFVYISTYTQPAGGNPERLKKSLLKNLDTLEQMDTTDAECLGISLVEADHF